MRAKYRRSHITGVSNIVVQNKDHRILIIITVTIELQPSRKGEENEKPHCWNSSKVL